ncbi:MAG: HAD hydrolase-like protein [Nitrososphaeraceae archaeon]|nr:HAD hydrolase-like protein [Nitrososphaeraceae archaeon]
MEKLFLIFSSDQTLINEWNFIEYFDKKIFEQINGFGARIDFRNYMALRNNIIQTKKIPTGRFEEIICEICKLTLPTGYDKIILTRIQTEIRDKRKKYSFVNCDVRKTIEKLSENYCLGLISYHEEYSELLRRYNIYDLFKFVLSFHEDIRGEDEKEKILLVLIKKANVIPSNCVLIGSRLNSDIYYGNKLGMMTIRLNDSIFSLQSPKNRYEVPCFSVKNFKEIIKIIYSSIA